MIQEAFSLDPVPPFRLDLTAWALRRRPTNRIDQWDGTTWTRVLLLDGQPAKVMVSQSSPMMCPQLQVTVMSPASLVQLPARVSSILQYTLGYATDVSAFYALAERDQQIATLARQFMGLKPPRFPSLFEAFLNAFACQQVSLEVGIMLLNRLTERYGVPFADEQGVSYAFPGPEQLVNASIEDLRTLGWSQQKARALLELASLLVNGQQDFSRFETMNNEEVCRTIMPLRGVGRWTAEYLLLRGLGRIEMFPGDDVGAQKNLQMLLSLDEKPAYERIKALTARWHPYAGFVYFHLLLRRLYEKGLVPEIQSLPDI
ncbi:MAG: DNA-3-methyladenine glycosylase 2 [Ktedonobacteraceae bacterium]|nr:DNA-3-methyladenine glycosylase 2 [Ktedonobacteraceae bacterium]